MIITKQKDRSEILKYLGKEARIFIIGCGECATVCRTGGEKETADMKKFLEGHGISVSGFCLPEAPCIASQARSAIGKNKKAIKESDALLIMACGLAVQSVKENMPFDKALHIANDTLFMGEVTKSGDFLERCGACGECILELTGGMCPVTRCPKGLLNGPCGGVNKSKCEVSPDIDCVWVLIYEDLKEKGKTYLLRNYTPPKDHSKMLRPRKLVMSSEL